MSVFTGCSNHSQTTTNEGRRLPRLLLHHFRPKKLTCNYCVIDPGTPPITPKLPPMKAGDSPAYSCTIHYPKISERSNNSKTTFNQGRLIPRLLPYHSRLSYYLPPPMTQCQLFQERPNHHQSTQVDPLPPPAPSTTLQPHFQLLRHRSWNTSNHSRTTTIQGRLIPRLLPTLQCHLQAAPINSAAPHPKIPHFHVTTPPRHQLHTPNQFYIHPQTLLRLHAKFQLAPHTQTHLKPLHSHRPYPTRLKLRTKDLVTSMRNPEFHINIIYQKTQETLPPPTMPSDPP